MMDRIVKNFYEWSDNYSVENASERVGRLVPDADWDEFMSQKAAQRQHYEALSTRALEDYLDKE